MYIKKDKQISLFDFGQEAGLQLDPNNRWVKLREMIDWDEIEEKYSKLFCRNNGRRAKIVQMGIGALLIKQMQGFSDEEVVLHIQENPYMQYFCGIERYSNEKPFVQQMMTEYRKRFNEEIIKEINEAMFRKLAQEENKDKDKDSNKDELDKNPPNKGTLILDATCAPANIAYPQDIKLCNEAREKTEEMIETMHKANKGKIEKPRLDKKKARASYLKIAKSKTRKGKFVRKSIKQQLSYIRRNLCYIEKLINQGHYNLLTNKQKVDLETIKKLYLQQKYMIDNRTHSVQNRIVNISQAHVRPILRGKARNKVEFGAKVAISVIGGYSFVDNLSWEAYNENSDLIKTIENYKTSYGYYPEAVMVDKIYRTRANLIYCNSKGIRISGPKLGRPKKGYSYDKKQAYIDSGIRNEVEGKFGIGKIRYGLDKIKARLKATAQTVINLVFLAMNLQKRLRFLLCKILEIMFRRKILVFG